MALHFAIAGLMASRGHYVDQVGDNPNLRWVIKGAPAKGVIACSYIFVGFYGLTWVRFFHLPDPRHKLIIPRRLLHGFTARRFSP